MEIFKSGVDLLQLGVTAMGGGAVLMGMLNIFESLSSDNPGPRAQGMRQAFGGGVIVLMLVLRRRSRLPDDRFEADVAELPEEAPEALIEQSLSFFSQET